MKKVIIALLVLASLFAFVSCKEAEVENPIQLSVRFATYKAGTSTDWGDEVENTKPSAPVDNMEAVEIPAFGYSDLHEAVANERKKVAGVKIEFAKNEDDPIVAYRYEVLKLNPNNDNQKVDHSMDTWIDISKMDYIKSPVYLAEELSSEGVLTTTGEYSVYVYALSKSGIMYSNAARFYVTELEAE